MANKIINGTVRLVVMVPETIEFEFSGNTNLLQSISEHMIERKFPDLVTSAWSDDLYAAKLLESSVKEPDPEEIDLDEYIAPGIP